MSETAVKAQIKAIMQSVSGIGAVHDRQRFVRSLPDFLSLMSSGGKVNGWTIRRVSTPTGTATLGNPPQVDRSHTYKIMGIYDLDDAGDSESSLQALLEAMFAAFKVKRNLNATCLHHDQLQVDAVTESEEGDYGDDIYHLAECTLVVHERS